MKTKQIVFSGMVAAIYVALVSLLPSLSFFALQLRVAEVFTVLPFLFPPAIPGLFVGCLISNLLFSPFGLPDYIIGPLATLAAAYLTSRCKTRWLAPLPPIILNAAAVGATITLFDPDLGKSMSVFAGVGLEIFISQSIVCAGLGIPLLFAMEKLRIKERFAGI